ncbi:hypothetical protein ACGFJ7_23490 [Actinoplanes sp. NPDC048988]|uniref:hypothetical protein n=1 Tax=Actinoplanes sp. NPDC048988 TaxID=3363901 RepID=UPI003721E31E
MGASGWEYYTDYQPDLSAAFAALQRTVLDQGRYWWAVPGTSAASRPDRPRTMDELWNDEAVRESGTHSILDMDRVLDDGEEPRYGYLPYADDPAIPFQRYGEPEYGVIVPVTPAEAQATAGTEKLTRAHVEAIADLAEYRWIGRVAVLHGADGTPDELYFFGFSGD